MKYLRKLSLSLTLICVLTGAALGDGSQPPACPPGETNTPPCAAQPMNEELVVPGQTNTPPDLPVVGVTDIAETVLWALTLF